MPNPKKRMTSQTSTRNLIAIAVGALALVGVTALAASYMTRESIESEPKQQAKITRTYQPTSQHNVAQQRLPECDDGNIVGAIGGAVAGGVIGSNVGSGSGKTAATIGGTLGGAYLGKEYIPTKGVTCR